MLKANLSEIASYINARLVGEDTQVSNVYTDSRKTSSQGLFVALKGDNFDAHQFLQQVEKEGAKAVLVEKPANINIPQLVVDNTRLGLGKLAKFHREKLNTKFIAITGSSGKTTVKEMLAAILGKQGKTHATRGNYNNDIGVPLTLLQVKEDDQFAVLELGANHAGEIAYTVDLVMPDVALINNVGASHLSGFGDLEGVASAKGEIFSKLKNDGVAVINNDDQFADFWKESLQQRKSLDKKESRRQEIITFSRQKQADLMATNIQLNEEQYASFMVSYKQNQYPINLPLAGEHQVSNALAAIACSLALDIDLESACKGLSAVNGINGRMNIETFDNGCRIIDDSYNANVASTEAAIHLLAGYKQRRILVFGDMAELGDFSRQAHINIGKLAKECQIDALYTHGKYTSYSQEAFMDNNNQTNFHGEHFSDKEQLIEKLREEIKSGVIFLVKGSRSSKMEDVVHALRELALQKSNLQESAIEKTELNKQSITSIRGEV